MQKNYHKIGKLIIESQGGTERAKYGNGLIKEYSKKLTFELGKKYSTRYLELMRKFYLFQKTKSMISILSWTHYTLLFGLKDLNEINFYMNYIDKNLKKLDDNKTIGIILCHKNNKLILKYCSDPRIIIREYTLN